MPTLNLGLGLWQGKQRGITRQWLRWNDAEGNWIPMPELEELGEALLDFSTLADLVIGNSYETCLLNETGGVLDVLLMAAAICS